MGKITELQKLVENTPFDLDIVDMYNWQDLLLKFSTTRCKSGLYLEVKLEQEIDIYMTVDLCYEDESQPIMVNYSFNDVNSIIKVLTNIISNTCTVSDKIGNEISKLETSIMLAPSVDWVEIFKDGLFNIFKDVDIDRTEYLTVHLIGIDLIVEFDDDTHAFSVKVAQTTNPDNNKAVLIGVVCDNNYNQVLVSVRTVYNNIKEQYSNLEYLSQKIMWGR